MMCSGKYAPIPSQYSDSMKALIDTLIRKEPTDRPDLEVSITGEFPPLSLQATNMSFNVVEKEHYQMRLC